MDDYIATITNPQRAKELRDIFGTATLPVMRPTPERMDLPDRPGALVYLLDIAALTPEQVQRLTLHIVDKYHLPACYIPEEFERGIPILATDCVVACADPDRRIEGGNGQVEE